MDTFISDNGTIEISIDQPSHCSGSNITSSHNDFVNCFLSGDVMGIPVEVNMDGSIRESNGFDGIMYNASGMILDNHHQQLQQPLQLQQQQQHSSNPSSPSVVPNGHSSPYDPSSMGTPDTVFTGLVENVPFVFGSNNNNINNDINNMFGVDGQQQLHLQQEPSHTAITFTQELESQNDIADSTTTAEIDEKLKSIFERKPSASPLLPASPTTTASNPSSSPSLNHFSTEESSSSDSETVKDKNQKKRPMENSRVQNLVHPLTREELLKISGKEPVKIEAKKSSNLEEDRTYKKQRRLIKNRESAQLSRMRKKIYIEDLEKKISDLTSENTSLRDEVLYLQGVIKQFASSNPSILKTTNVQSIETTKKNVKAAGVCLLIIIFSIGIFLNPSQQQAAQPTFTQLTPTRGVRTLATFQDNNNNNNAVANRYTNVSPNTNLLTLPNHERDPIVYSNSNSNSIGNNFVQLDSSNNNNKKRVVEPTLEQPAMITSEHSQNKKRMRIVSEDDELTMDDIRSPDRTSTSVTNNNLNVVGYQQQQSESPLHNRNYISAELVNTSVDSPHSYILFTETPRIISNNLTQTTELLFGSSPSQPLSIGLLIPSDTLSLNASGDHQHPQEQSILEISCLVSNIRVWNPSGQQQQQQQQGDSDIIISSRSPLVIPSN